MTGPREVRSSKRQGTLYFTTETRREQKAGIGVPGVIDNYIGRSPGLVLKSVLVKHDDVDGNYQAKVRLPAGAITTGRFWILVTEPFDGTGSDAITLGDENDPNGYFAAADAIDLQAAAGTMYGPVDAANGAEANQPYRHAAGGYLIIDVGTGAGTQGECIIFAEIFTYCEDLDAENNLS